MQEVARRPDSEIIFQVEVVLETSTSSDDDHRDSGLMMQTKSSQKIHTLLLLL